MYTELEHLWSWRDIWLEQESRVYYATALSVLLYSCETWILRGEGVHCLEISHHRCLRSMAKIGKGNYMGNVQVTNLVLRAGFENILWQDTITSQTSLVGQRVAYSEHSLDISCKVSRCSVGLEATRRSTGQQVTWNEKLKVKLSKVCVSRLLGWAAKYPSTNMTENHESWWSCRHFLLN